MSRINSKKLFLAKVFGQSGLNSVLAMLRKGAFGTHARAVNYHDISSTMLDAFEEQLEFFQRNYVNVGRAELDLLLAGRWNSNRPGVLLTFDDGLRSHAEHAAPLLEKYGFTGWFFVPTQFVETPADEQWEFAKQHSICPFEEDYANARVAMSWDEIRGLDSRGHVVGSHTWHHEHLRSTLTDEQLEREIVESKASLEAHLAHEVDVFCWVGGEEWSYSRNAADVIRRAGYRLSFMTNNLPVRPGSNPLQIQRTNVEAWFPARIVEFQLNGILDVVYTAKRRRVNRLTSADAG